MKTYPGFEQAYIGIGERCGCDPIAVYSYDKMVQIVSERDNIDIYDAIDYIDFNYLGAWLGDDTPLIITLQRDDVLDSPSGEPK